MLFREDWLAKNRFQRVPFRKLHTSSSIATGGAPLATVEGCTGVDG